VFWGNEADFTFPFRVQESGEIRNISFRMIPIQREGELQNILVTGRPVPVASLAGMFLDSETSTYVMDNNRTQLYDLSYRLTRIFSGTSTRARYISYNGAPGGADQRRGTRETSR
jgi:hypothetical protein